MRFTLASLASFAQVTNQPSCVDTTKYRLAPKESDTYGEIQIKVDGKWASFSIMDETPDMFEYRCEEVELNGSGSKELVLFWKNATYGSGGGFAFKGIKIWNLDNGIVLFNEIYSCSEESFGRHGSERFLIEYRKNIEVSELSITVNEEEFLSEGSESDLSSLGENCVLTDLKAGVYTLQNGKLVFE